jgi:hypothetical protein
VPTVKIVKNHILEQIFGAGKGGNNDLFTIFARQNLPTSGPEERFR